MFRWNYYYCFIVCDLKKALVYEIRLTRLFITNNFVKFRNSRLEAFYGKGALKKFCKIHRKTPAPESLFQNCCGLLWRQSFFWHTVNDQLSALGTYFKSKHCVKSLRICSYSGPYFPAFGLKTGQNNSEYGRALRSENLLSRCLSASDA